MYHLPTLSVPRLLLLAGAGLFLGLIVLITRQQTGQPTGGTTQDQAAVGPISPLAFPTQDQPTTRLAAASVGRSVGRPVRLLIPHINVAAAIEAVGLTASGAMDTPKDPDQVAWFAPGERPGDTGSAVIAGHYDWYNRQPAVFVRLSQLVPGDKLLVLDDQEQTTTFVVRESRSYDPQADASDVFGSSDGRSHLNLVTCEGTWDAATGSYSQRLVVFADQE